MKIPFISNQTRSRLFLASIIMNLCGALLLFLLLLVKLGVIRIDGTGGGYMDNPQYDAYLSMFELNDEKTEIIFLGDSITARGRFEEFFREKAVLNRGIGSDVSLGILNRLDEVLIHEPSQIFIMAGINDLSHGVAPKELGENMDKIVKTINNSLPDTEVYLQSILPVIDSKVSLDEICNANRELESVAQENDCSYVDLYRQFMDRNGDVISRYLSADGVHLTGAGYAAWVETIEEYIMSD